MHRGQPRNLAGAHSLPKEFEDLENLGVWQLCVEQRCALELGEPSPTRIAVKESMMTLGKRSTNREIAGITLPMPMAVGILAAETGEAVGVVHDKGTSKDCRKYF